ncbi:MAG: 1-acyl-sn-glycerol-3-phosphate acyltransferase [Chloroflexi bacterium]|nr:1-acyl-sn-glycerol-3-phosphate acyltransferase [Chloroflexota bacterium]
MFISSESADTQQVHRALLHEALGVLNLRRPAWARRAAEIAFHAPIARLTHILVDLNANAAQTGWRAAAAELLGHFVGSAEVHGADNLPEKGPLLVVSNHPAAYDAIMLASLLPRDDLKIVSSNISPITCLPAIAPHFIFVTNEAHGRMAAARAALHHMLEGGALLIFPRGEVEPDPAVSPGALESLARWSHSLDLFLRKAPQINTIVAIVSGVLSKHWFDSPLLRLWKQPQQRQKAAEVFQVIQQLIGRELPDLRPSVIFAPPLQGLPPGEIMPKITAQAAALLDASQAA